MSSNTVSLTVLFGQVFDLIDILTRHWSAFYGFREAVSTPSRSGRGLDRWLSLASARRQTAYSHSIVAGGLLLMS